MPRMRTIDDAHKELITKDPNSSISKHYIRYLVTTGQLPTKKAGKKYLLNMEHLEAFLAGDD